MDIIINHQCEIIIHFVTDTWSYNANHCDFIFYGCDITMDNMTHITMWSWFMIVRSQMNDTICNITKSSLMVFYITMVIKMHHNCAVIINGGYITNSKDVHHPEVIICYWVITNDINICTIYSRLWMQIKIHHHYDIKIHGSDITNDIMMHSHYDDNSWL